MKNSFYSQKELKGLGFKTFGKSLMISRFARFYDIQNIQIGNYVRIDDFCILSGNITLGSFIHISAYSALYGKFGIEMQDYSGISPRCTIFSASDDFSGDFLIGPMVDSSFTNLITGKVIIKKYSQLGSNCIVFPKVTINEGVLVGAMSLIKYDLEAWNIYKGIPATLYKERSRKLLDYNLHE